MAFQFIGKQDVYLEIANKYESYITNGLYKAGDKLIPFEVVGKWKGTELEGMRYEQLLPWVKPVEADEQGNWKEASNKAFRVILGDYVTVEDGTGIDFEHELFMGRVFCDNMFTADYFNHCWIVYNKVTTRDML